MRNYCIFLLLCTLSVSCAIIDSDYFNKNDSLLKCINKIEQKYFKQHLLIISTVKFEMNIFEYNNRSTLTIYSRSKIAVPKLFWKFNYFLFIIKHSSEIQEILNSLYGKELWNSRGLYLVVYFGQEDISEIFRICWDYYIFNVNVLAAINNTFGVYTFFPYKNNLCGKYDSYELLQNCGNSSELVEMYPEKIPNDVNGCEIRMMAYPMIPYVINLKANREKASKAGLEVTIVHVLSQRMNFTTKYIPHNHSFWGFKDLSNKYQFMFGSLYNKECDLTLGMQFGNASHVIDFDGSYVHLMDASVWWVPIAMPIAQWKNLTKIFKPIVWLTILGVLVINGLALYLIGRNREPTHAYNDIVLSMMTSLYSMLQGSVESPKTWTIRSMFEIWLLCCLLIFTAYQCQLVSILTSPLYEHQITSMDEVVTSSLSYGMFVGAALAYTDPTNWVHVLIYKNYYPCPLSNYCLNRTAFQRDFAAYRNLRNSRYFIPRYYTNANGKVLVYATEGNALGIWVRFYTTKGYPLLGRINNLLMLLQSNGLIAKWDSDISFFVLKIESEPDHRPLTLDHLQGAFLVLSIGLSIAIIAFFSEFCYAAHKISKQRRINKKIIPFSK